MKKKVLLFFSTGTLILCILLNIILASSFPILGIPYSCGDESFIFHTNGIVEYEYTGSKGFSRDEKEYKIVGENTFYISINGYKQTCLKTTYGFILQSDNDTLHYICNGAVAIQFVLAILIIGSTGIIIFDFYKRYKDIINRLNQIENKN